MKIYNPDLYIAKYNDIYCEDCVEYRNILIKSINGFVKILAISKYNDIMILIPNDNNYSFRVLNHRKQDLYKYSKEYDKYLHSNAMWVEKKYLSFKFIDCNIKCRK